MMFAPRVLAAFAMFGSIAGATPALAADVTPAQATELEAALRGWMAGLLSPAVDVGARPVQVIADGDHFNVVLPAPAILSNSGVTAPGLAVNMKAKPLDGGRWALDDLAIPTPLTLNAPKGAPDDAAGKSMTISAATQEFHGIFDPSYATTSSFDSMVTGLRIVSPNSVSTTGRSASHSTWQPAGEGRINVLMEGNAEKSSNTISPKDSESFTYTIDKSTSSGRINAVAPATLATLIRSVAALAPTLPGTKDSLNPEQRTLARAVVFSLRDMLAGVEAGQKLNDIKFTAQGHSGTIKRAGFGTKMGVTDGKLELATEISVEGVDSPEIPKGIYRDYLPRKITLKPRISGVPSEDLVKLLLRAIDSDANDLAELQEAAMGLLGAGPLEIAIDELGIDLGRASLAGTGSLDVASVTDITGEAEINLKGLDALIKTANTTPDLKQIAPVLIFLKGIGKQDGDATVWNIAYQDNNITVNDTDLSALMPGGGKK
jgi:hypothetical protein